MYRVKLYLSVLFVGLIGLACSADETFDLSVRNELSSTEVLQVDLAGDTRTLDIGETTRFQSVGAGQHIVTYLSTSIGVERDTLDITRDTTILASVNMGFGIIDTVIADTVATAGMSDVTFINHPASVEPLMVSLAGVLTEVAVGDSTVFEDVTNGSQTMVISGDEIGVGNLLLTLTSNTIVEVQITLDVNLSRSISFISSGKVIPVAPD